MTESQSLESALVNKDETETLTDTIQLRSSSRERTLTEKGMQYQAELSKKIF